MLPFDDGPSLQSAEDLVLVVAVECAAELVGFEYAAEQVHLGSDVGYALAAERVHLG